VVAIASLAAALITPATSAPAPNAPTVAVAATGETTEVTVRVDGMSYSPQTITVPAGDRLVITFENTGDQHHDLVLASGAETDVIAPGGTTMLDAVVIGSSMAGWCSLPGHRSMGMELSIVATNAPLGTVTLSPHSPDGVQTDVTAPSMTALMEQANMSTAMPA